MSYTALCQVMLTQTYNDRAFPGTKITFAKYMAASSLIFSDEENNKETDFLKIHCWEQRTKSSVPFDGSSQSSSVCHMWLHYSWRIVLRLNNMQTSHWFAYGHWTDECVRGLCLRVQVCGYFYTRLMTIAINSKMSKEKLWLHGWSEWVHPFTM